MTGQGRRLLALHALALASMAGLTVALVEVLTIIQITRRGGDVQGGDCPQVNVGEIGRETLEILVGQVAHAADDRHGLVV